ncbi:MAG: tetratricopeptide repeat-containing sulfotransferase family protein [Pseudohaliea sp.]
MTAPRDRRSLQRAAARQPGDPAIHERLARTLLAAQDLDGLRTLQPTLDSRFGHQPFTHLVAGHAAKAMGDRELAAQRYRRALALTPASGEALYNLVDLGAVERDDAEGRMLGDLAGRNDLPAADRVNILFALARLEEKDGAPRKALAHYHEANDLARSTLAERGIRHDEAAAERCLQADLANWQARSFAAPLEPPAIDLTPVFVTGLPRSGTTLVEQILASHPEVAAGGELTVGPAAERDCRRALGLAPTDPLPPPADGTFRAALARAREQYLDGLFERGLDARWVVDKLPANARIAGFLRLLFPGAPIIHCSREPRALAWSLYTANFAAHEPWVHDLAAMEGVFRRHHRLVAHWREALPAPFVAVVYEDLVHAPERAIRALLSSCGIPFDPATLHPEKLERPVFTASHSQVRRPIYTEAVERWRPYAAALEAFAGIA